MLPYFPNKLLQLLPDNRLTALAKEQLVSTAGGYIHAFVHIIVAFSWLLILLLSMAFGTAEMPLNGEAGILPAFQVPPFAPLSAQTPTVAVQHLSVAPGFGYFLLLIGIIIGGLATLKKVVITVIALVIFLPILYFISHDLFQHFIVWLGF